MTVDDLDQLLSERFNLQRADLLAALKRYRRSSREQRR
jgi:hypothetical protein